MTEEISTGTILQGVGGFYTTLDDEGREYTLRAQGKLRRERLKPKVGDRVEMMPGEGLLSTNAIDLRVRRPTHRS